MKKVLALVAAILLGSVVAGYAQDYNQSIGIKVNYGVSAVYKQFIGSQKTIEGLDNAMNKIGRASNAFEVAVNLDLFYGVGINASGAYFWQYQIGDIQGFSWYVGPAVSVGAYFSPAVLASIGIHVQGGIEYKFKDIPLALSLDYGPGLGMLIGEAFGVGFAGIGGLGVKYTF